MQYWYIMFVGSVFACTTAYCACIPLTVGQKKHMTYVPFPPLPGDHPKQNLPSLPIITIFYTTISIHKHHDPWSPMIIRHSPYGGIHHSPSLTSNCCASIAIKNRDARAWNHAAGRVFFLQALRLSWTAAMFGVETWSVAVTEDAHAMHMLYSLSRWGSAHNGYEARWGKCFNDCFLFLVKCLGECCVTELLDRKHCTVFSSEKTQTMSETGHMLQT